MSKSLWKAYEKAIITWIPRLKPGDEELEHRAKLAWAREWANRKRSEVEWHTDNVLILIDQLVGAYGVSSQVRPDQVKALWETVSALMTIAAQLQASELR